MHISKKEENKMNKEQLIKSLLYVFTTLNEAFHKVNNEVVEERLWEAITDLEYVIKELNRE
jgi:hypothetical protein